MDPKVMVAGGAAAVVLLIIVIVFVRMRQASSAAAPEAAPVVVLVPPAPVEVEREDETKKEDGDERKGLMVLGKRPFTAYGNDEGARTLRQTASSAAEGTSAAMAFPTAVPLSERLQDAWESADAYDIETGNPSSETATILVGGKAVKGEWLQLELPVPALVKTYTIHSAIDADDKVGARRAPRDWSLLGSKDGAAWNVLDRRQGAEVGKTDHAVPEENAEYYRFFRLVFERVGLKEDRADPLKTRVRISDWVLRAPSYL